MLKRIFYILLLFISVKAAAQRTNSSPYSFFGIGQQYSSQTVEQASMGGVGVSFSDVYHLNFINPAAHANLRFTTYSVGLNVNDLTIKDFSSSQRSTSTSLSYINVGFPLGNKFGIAFGLKPNTNVGYSLLNVENDLNGNRFNVTRFYGSGGTNRIYGAFGASITNDLSLGLEIEYIFGEIENNILSQRVNVVLGTKNNELTTVNGSSLKLGMLYKKALSKKVEMKFGAALKLENNLTTKGEEYLYSTSILANGFDSPRDTLSSALITGSIKNPLKTTLGVSFGSENKWYAALDYEFQNALKVNGSLLTSNSSYTYGNSSKISFGGFYIPKINSISSYWHRVIYRAGLRFENLGLLVRGSNVNGFTEVKDFGISFGLGLPLKDLSNLNLGFEYGKKGKTINNLIQENYFNFKLSLSLSAFGNLAWFQKRKID